MAFYIKKIDLKNVRCFSKAKLDFALPKASQGPWSLVLGDNATGKSALLRSIAIGLCDETSAAGLIKESDAGYIRRNEEDATITIELHDPQCPKKRYRVKTSIFYGDDSKTFEIVRQETTPKKFPWGELFICGYGASRGSAGTGDISGYTQINAVYNMFNYSEGLQNPELVLRRLLTNKDEKYRDRLFAVIAKAIQSDRVTLSPSGIVVDGHWGKKMPLRDLADGYKSTFQWVTDFIGWALAHRPNTKNLAKFRGIVILDEIEQNLHPKWQRSVVDSLRSSFPAVQFIASTHSPIVVSTVGEFGGLCDGDSLVYLSLGSNNKSSARTIPTKRGQSPNQILGSDAFDYALASYRDPAVAQALREASILSGRGKKRTPSEERRYQFLKRDIANRMLEGGEFAIERDVESEWDAEMNARLRKLQRRLLT